MAKERTRPDIAAGLVALSVVSLIDDQAAVTMKDSKGKGITVPLTALIGLNMSDIDRQTEILNPAIALKRQINDTYTRGLLGGLIGVSEYDARYGEGEADKTLLIAGKMTAEVYDAAHGDGSAAIVKPAEPATT